MAAGAMRWPPLRPARNVRINRPVGRGFTPEQCTRLRDAARAHCDDGSAPEIVAIQSRAPAHDEEISAKAGVSGTHLRAIARWFPERGKLRPTDDPPGKFEHAGYRNRRVRGSAPNDRRAPAEIQPGTPVEFRGVRECCARQFRSGVRLRYAPVKQVNALIERGVDAVVLCVPSVEVGRAAVEAACSVPLVFVGRNNDAIFASSVGLHRIVPHRS